MKVSAIIFTQLQCKRLERRPPYAARKKCTHNGKWYYLAGYLDLLNDEIVEWELSDRGMGI